MAIPVPKKYIADFEKMGMGLFVHFGIYSQIARGEWIYSLGDQSPEEYQRLVETFTAEDFDAEKLVLTAKNAGCKYITVDNSRYAGSYSFGNVTDKIKIIEWMDTHEKIEFIQGGEMLSVNATGYPHGMSTCVRVAKALIENSYK